MDILCGAHCFTMYFLKLMMTNCSVGFDECVCMASICVMCCEPLPIQAKLIPGVMG